MTLGELARLFNAEKNLGARLHVITMRRYERAMWFDQTGFAWVPPSPNLRKLEQAVLYPGVGMIEAANVSVGRGTDAPFELDGRAMDRRQGHCRPYERSRRIAGVRFEAATFTPREWVYPANDAKARIVLTESETGWTVAARRRADGGALAPSTAAGSRSTARSA
jgi:uncharacterized protein YbbC (DUF1343 family)